MPELPEVETIVRQLAVDLPGRRIRGIRVRHSDLLAEPAPDFSRALRHREILEVTRRGKNILLLLSEAQVLRVNLGMTGQLLFHPGNHAKEAPPHLAVTFTLLPSGRLNYVDARRFGSLALFSGSTWQAESDRLGPEPLGRALTPEVFHRSLQASRAPVRSWLLDQTRIAGVGNIYAAEALFLAGIHPRRPAQSLSRTESTALLSGIRDVLRKAIRARGTTLRDYRTASGAPGGFAPALRVYGREGEDCPRCKAPVRRVVFANRSAFFCPRCQPEPS